MIGICAELGDKWAAEIADQTMHGILSVGWVADGTRSYRRQAVAT